MRNSQILGLVAAMAFLTPGMTLRILNIVAIKKTLGIRVAWVASVVSGVVGTIAMVVVVFLAGQFSIGLTVKWIMGLDRDKPLSKVESVLLAPTRREPDVAPRNTDSLGTLASQTGLDPRTIAALLAPIRPST